MSLDEHCLLPALAWSSQDKLERGSSRPCAGSPLTQCHCSSGSNQEGLRESGDETRSSGGGRL